MLLPKNVSDYLSVFKANGYGAFVVGGAVRDALIGVDVYDYDVATDATPDEIKRIFSDHKTIDTGIKHGTVTVVFNGQAFETTTFRVDGVYGDCRHPESVTFTTDIAGDLSRRDFTINAMAYCGETGLVDLFGGKADIDARLIRAVGDPEKRFEEDALRILRAVRFAAKTGFSIEENTFCAMIEKKTLLKNVSSERIFDELTKIILCPDCRNALFKCKEVLFEVIPELKAADGFDQKNAAHLYDVFTHTLYTLELLKDRTPITCWAALLHDIGKPLTLVIDEKGVGHFPRHMEVSARIAHEILTRFKASNDLIHRVETIVSVHDKGFYTKYAVKKFINKYDVKMFEDFLTLTYADIFAHSDIAIKRFLPEREDIKRFIKEIVDNGECYRLSELDISGNTLLEMGFSGEAIGKILNDLLDAVMSGAIPNDKAALVDFIKEKY